MNALQKRIKGEVASLRNCDLPVEHELPCFKLGKGFHEFGKAARERLFDFDCSSVVLPSRRAKERKPSHFGSYCHCLPRGIALTDNTSIGGTGEWTSSGIPTYRKS